MAKRKTPVMANKLDDEVISRAHLRVIDEYLKDFNKKAAMIRAGYSESYAQSKRNQHSIFGNTLVTEEVQRRQKATARKAGIDKEKIIAKLSEIAFGELGKFMRVGEDGLLRWDFTRATTEELNRIDMLATETYVEGRGEEKQTVKKFKITRKDQLRAIDMLCKMLGFYDESLTLKGELTIVERLQQGRARVKADV